jgi:hypothetical protein
MLGTNVASDLDLTSIPSSITCATSWGIDTVRTRLETPTHSISELKRRQLPLLALRHTDAIATTAMIHSELKHAVAPHQDIVSDLCKCKDSEDSRIEESTTQILWSPTSLLAPLNEHSTIINGLVTWKTLIVPIITVLMPILAVLVPFFLLRFIHGSQDVQVNGYIKHVKTVILKQISMPSFLRPRHDGDVVGHLFEYLFLGLTIATFGSGIWNQVQAALHLRTIAADLRSRGIGIYSLVQSAKRCLTLLESLPSFLQKALRHIISEGKSVLADFSDIPEGLAAFGTVWNNPTPLRSLRNWLGVLDAHIALAMTDSICFPTFSEKQVPLRLHNVYHPALGKGAVRNSVVWNQNHVLLTGPNRGGKSTFCKSVGLSIVYAQTWGIAWADRMHLQPFVGIETALAPADVLGKLSLFEAEIEFAKGVLNKCNDLCKSGPIFVMMDEIFHSTNAHDGVAASKIFLDSLYTIPQVYSIISTHYQQLVTDFSAKTEAWAVQATEQENGLLHYSYRVEKGVSDKSSVMEILKERGLVPDGPDKTAA